MCGEKKLDRIMNGLYNFEYEKPRKQKGKI